MFFRSASAIISLVYVMTIGVSQGFACKCASGFHGNSRWELAKAEAQGTDVIFEGTPERIEMHWWPFSAREGNLIPATSDATTGAFPRMVITFRVNKVFKGDLGSEVQITTGMGGGDCGGDFSSGLPYLVYSRKSTQGELTVNMCSPGGWIGNTTVAVELRYLRHEQPTLGDLKIQKHWTAMELAEQEKENKQNFEEQVKRYSAATGTICGTVALNSAKGEVFGLLSFLSTNGSSPVPFAHPTVDVRAGGAFCSGRLAPGKYRLHFMRFSNRKLASSVYFPGVEDPNQATPIEVSAGTSQAGIIFNEPKQKTYAVRGFISTNDRSQLAQGNVSIALIRADGLMYPSPYVESVDFRSDLPLPRIKYFQFEHVLPGKYIALASVDSSGWFMKKVEVTVATHMKFISLELIRKN